VDDLTVRWRASVEARKYTIAAMSSGVPARLVRVAAMSVARRSSVSRSPKKLGRQGEAGRDHVRRDAARSQRGRQVRRPRLHRRLGRAVRAGPGPGGDRPIVMIRPPSGMRGVTAVVTSTAESTLAAQLAFQRAATDERSSPSPARKSVLPPALLTSTSTVEGRSTSRPRPGQLASKLTAPLPAG
jgi:hypothetical protein